MKRLLLAALFTSLAFSASAQSPSCNAQATEKKLHGAAHTSFMTKCTNDAKAACETAATDRKLSGAAKTSFTNKCIHDATGA